MTPHQERLIADHRRASGERERAEIEHMLWELCPESERTLRKWTRGRYLAAAFGEKEHKIDDRAAIRNTGPEAAALLWNRIEGDMTLRTARDIVALARKSQSRDETLREAVARELTGYDARPIQRRTANGKVVRVLGRVSTPSQAEPPRPARAPRAVEPGSRDFWVKMKELIRVEIETRLAGHGETVIREQTARLEGDLKVVFAEFSARMGQIRGKTPFGVAVTRGRLVEACRVLHLDIPSKTEVDDGSFERQAKPRFRKLARQYHPDTSGTDATASLMQSVMEAWNVVQQYCAQARAGAAR
jgi:hypothetical protein